MAGCDVVAGSAASPGTGTGILPPAWAGADAVATAGADGSGTDSNAMACCPTGRVCEGSSPRPITVASALLLLL